MIFSNFLPLFLCITPNAIAMDWDVSFQWNYFNFTWKSSQQTHEFSYSPEAYAFSGIDIYKSNLYICFPRTAPNSRITLGKVDLKGPSNNALIEPFPNWKMNSGDDCSTLNNVQCMRTDLDGILWVLDTRRNNNLTSCPPKIVLLDLNQNGKVLKSFVIPETITPSTGSFINDIVIDGDWAYLTDTTANKPGLIAYNRKTDQIWKFVDDSTMMGNENPNAMIFTSQGALFNEKVEINGIALSSACQKNKKVYFSALSSYNIYSVSTKVLRNCQIASNGTISKYISLELIKQGQSDGMMMDSLNRIFYGLVGIDGVGWYNTKNGKVKMIYDHEIMKWPNSFAFDGKGYLYIACTNVQRLKQYGIENLDVNFSVIRMRTKSSSYLTCGKV